MPKCSKASFVAVLFIAAFAADSQDDAGSCLSNAIPKASRKKLINSTGHSYEVGLWVSQWSAAALLSAMLHILIEEKIGYNVTETGPGPGMPDAFYALTGCATPTDVTDPGCGDGPTGTTNHVNIEGWTLGYLGVWDEIQKKYPATAPKNLGSSGYFGKQGEYLETATVKRASDAEGAMLDFFRGYNASWYDQSKYFGDITSVNTSLLKPCAKTRFMIHEMMQVYVELTGDFDGVEIVEGKVQGKCWDRYFWFPPSCRHDRSKCILYATAGAGWGLGAIIQKATVWNMPIAPIVAKDWSSFVQIPHEVACLFYWWEPDPTFLLMQPTEIVFPQHEKQEWVEAIQTSSVAQVPIEKYVSYDLEGLAPSIVALVQGMQIDMVDVKELMMDALNTQDDAAVVACRWVKGHESTWEKWLPDATKCFPQFGLYNQISERFVEGRADLTALGCRACESGSFSVELQDDKGITHVCKPCPPGSAQPSGAAIACQPCPHGEYQDDFGQASCTRCPQGSYQDRKGQSSCKMCPNATSTLGLGSIAPEECRCEAGSINMASEGLRCIVCGEGLVCPFGSTVGGLQNGTSDVGEKNVAMIAEGFYSYVTNPTSIYKCTDKKRCPGGPPGSCTGGLTSAPCAQCLPGQTWSDEKCVDCDAATTGLWWVSVTAVLPSILAASYYFTNPKVAAKASAVQAGGAAFALVILLLQTVSILASTTITWPQNFRNSAAPLGIVLLDLEGLSFACFSNGAIVARYTTNILGFPLLVVWMWLCFAMSKFLPFQRLRWTHTKTCNSIGSLLQMSYGPMSMLALQPFMCYSHPNGAQSLLKQPGIVCGEGEHKLMLVGGCLLLILFVLGFLAVCLVATCRLPNWLARGNNKAALCFNFLTVRFRLDTWWFGVLSLVRMPALSLFLVMATDSPLAQAALSGTILAVFLVLLASVRPWKVPLLNEIDVFCSLCTLLLLLVGSQIPMTHVEAERLRSVAESFSVILMGCFTCGVVFLILVLATSFALSSLGGFDLNCLLHVGHGSRTQELAEKLHLVAAELSQLEGVALLKELQTMNPYDLSRLDRSFNFLIRELFLFPTRAVCDSALSTGISSRSYRASTILALESQRALPQPEVSAAFSLQDQHVAGSASMDSTARFPIHGDEGRVLSELEFVVSNEV